LWWLVEVVVVEVKPMVLDVAVAVRVDYYKVFCL
jgi:hypothetical protein